MQVVVRQSLTIGSTGLLLSLLSTYGALAQNSSCTNSWVNPQTGIQECLDGRIISIPSTQNQAGTVSSDTVTQSYRSQQFNTLPPDQLRSRMPLTSVIPSVNASSSLSTINGQAGAVPSSDAISNSASFSSTGWND